VKTHLPDCMRRFLGAAGILLFVTSFFLLSGNGAAQLSQPAATPGSAKASDGRASRVNSLVSPDAASRSGLVAAYGKLPLSFEANQGQTDAQVKFLSRGSGYTLFLTGHEAVLALQKAEGNTSKPEVPGEAGALKFETRHSPLGTRPPALVLRMSLVGVSEATQVSGLGELPGKGNYFIGNDREKWRTNVPNYAKVRYQNVYPGVDLVYYGNQGQLEYDFVVAPGADPAEIRLDVMADLGMRPSSAAGRRKRAHAGTRLRIAANGDLLVSLNGGEVRFHKPVVYQNVDTGFSRQPQDVGAEPLLQRRYSEGRYVLAAGNQVTFQVGAYDRTKPLVIDPVLTYSSYLGGSGIDQAAGIAVDGSGNAYVTGFTTSSDFPRVNQISGACNGSCGTAASFDAYVTKINASGTALVYSSYLGGSGDDQGSGIAVDTSGNAYLTGATNSSNFPRVNQISGACNGSCGSGSNLDSFVTKINAAGNALVYSSLVGGSGDDSNSYNTVFFNNITVDGAGNAYLTGQTYSTDFPRVNQISGACNGSCGTGFPGDVFVTKINAAGSALVYSSYLGGDAADIGYSIAVDGAGNAYVTGLTYSANFPRVNQIPGACNGSCGTGANYDIFVTKINAAGTALIYSSYLGGSTDDWGRGVAVDASGNVYLTGVASSTDFPSINQIPGVCAENSCGAFAAKINAAGNALVYSSRFGGSRGADQGLAVAVDTSGSAYILGGTQSADFPRVNQIMGACRGSCGTGANYDAFVMKINTAGNALVYSSYIGGSGDDNGGSLVGNAGIALDSLHNAYLGGFTISPDFPRGHIENAIPSSIPGACRGSCGTAGNGDAFVVKISP
jgi:Beta-propeller repeat